MAVKISCHLSSHWSNWARNIGSPQIKVSISTRRILGVLHHRHSTTQLSGMEGQSRHWMGRRTWLAEMATDVWWETLRDLRWLRSNRLFLTNLIIRSQFRSQECQIRWFWLYMPPNARICRSLRTTRNKRIGSFNIAIRRSRIVRYKWMKQVLARSLPLWLARYWQQGQIIRLLMLTLVRIIWAT